MENKVRKIPNTIRKTEVIRTHLQRAKGMALLFWPEMEYFAPLLGDVVSLRKERQKQSGIENSQRFVSNQPAPTIPMHSTAKLQDTKSVLFSNNFNELSLERERWKQSK